MLKVYNHKRKPEQLNDEKPGILIFLLTLLKAYFHFKKITELLSVTSVVSHQQDSVFCYSPNNEVPPMENLFKSLTYPS